MTLAQSTTTLPKTDSPAKSVLRAEQLTIGYKHPRRPPIVVAKELSCSLQTGELVCLLGPNGAGKSTLMRTLAGLQPLLGGQVWLDGDDLSTLRPRQLARRLSIVLTDRVDVGNLSVSGLVSLGRHPYTDWSGHLTAYDEEIVDWAIAAVGAGALAHRLVSELSDGERQKVMIARALAQEPMLMLLDEPTAYLDLPRRVEIMGVLRGLAHQTGRTILLSTHDLDLALRSADRIWLLSLDGHLQTGAPEDLILSGAFEAVFHSEGVAFDPVTGSFHIHRAYAGAVRLCGQGLAAIWTRRALERAGYRIADPSETPSPLPVVTIHGDGADTRWRLTIDGSETVHSTVYDLLRAVDEAG
jgi:iron complex transport system ATP-binding protein